MIRRMGMIALAVLASAAATQAREVSAETETVVVVLAHPDDELPMAPAIAALAREGRLVSIIHATPGDAGPGVSGMAKGEDLAATRRAEAQCAGRALGVAEVVNLGFGDGMLADHVRDSSLVAALADRIGEADTVLTWGPDGGYGHADHRMVSALTSQIVQAMPAGARPGLLYVGIPAGTLPPVPELADWAVTDPALLTETVPYTPADLEAAKAAAACHVTQFDEATRQGMIPLFDATMWRGKVHFRPAF
ncbi:PIG-L deacetylase family protein [Porphyrobacter sp. AAP60]|uniref:PIG-L deacetylase family protein n=1 Tax=Porphyrobacter sp. AAP60 TaxID=1523423 RepID=UPI000AF219ED|nr:PIG-L family deacetylase [Porphyrobacter sp. AAP60]